MQSAVSGFAAKATKVGFLPLLYHDAKMLACKGIFARSSIWQTVQSTVSGFAAKATKVDFLPLLYRKSFLFSTVFIKFR
jgi:hypothetical protein